MTAKHFTSRQHEKALWWVPKATPNPEHHSVLAPQPAWGRWGPAQRTPPPPPIAWAQPPGPPREAPPAALPPPASGGPAGSALPPESPREAAPAAPMASWAQQALDLTRPVHVGPEDVDEEGGGAAGGGASASEVRDLRREVAEMRAELRGLRGEVARLRARLE